jgi:hypothetical protein
MGIYYGDKIYGIKILSSTTILYIRQYDSEMTDEEKASAKNEYTKLTEQYGDDLYIFLYVDMTTTYDYPPVTSKTWMHLTSGINGLK